jgi:hypothetical protein
MVATKGMGFEIDVIITAVQMARLMSRRMAGVLLLSLGSPNMKLAMAVSVMNTQSNVVSLCV